MTYTIQILNNSGFAKSYVTFMDPPVVVSSGGDPQVFSNAWVTFGSITNGGFDRITYDATTYAYWGVSDAGLTPGTTVSSGGAALVDIGQQDSVRFAGGSPTGFEPVVHGGAMAGSFMIVSGTDFTPASGYVFGMAKPGQTPVPSPVAIFAAQPNDVFNVTPVQKVYVADGAYEPGEVLDMSAVAANLATIDFTGRPQRTATAVQNADGAWTVQYTA